MPTPHFRRRQSVLAIQAALAALAFSLPMTAGAVDVIVNISNGEDFSLGPNADHRFNVGNQDLLNTGPTNLGTTGTIGPNIAVSPPTPPANISPSGNEITIDGWDDSGLESSVAGGGGISNVFNNQLTFVGATRITGMATGGGILCTRAR
jgi:hypothetical protein